MDKTVIPNQRRRRKRSTFNPNHAYINESIHLYLQSGGKITKVIVNEDMFIDFLSSKEPAAANDFLTDGL